MDGSCPHYNPPHYERTSSHRGALTTASLALLALVTPWPKLQTAVAHPASHQGAQEWAHTHAHLLSSTKYFYETHLSIVEAYSMHNADDLQRKVARRPLDQLDQLTSAHPQPNHRTARQLQAVPISGSTSLTPGPPPPSPVQPPSPPAREPLATPSTLPPWLQGNPPIQVPASNATAAYDIKTEVELHEVCPQYTDGKAGPFRCQLPEFHAYSATVRCFSLSLFCAIFVCQ
jgi:hypothetical protein